MIKNYLKKNLILQLLYKFNVYNNFLVNVNFYNYNYNWKLIV